MKLKYELKKILTTNAFLLVALIIIVFSLLLFEVDLSLSNNKQISDTKLYSEVYDEIPKQDLNNLDLAISKNSKFILIEESLQYVDNINDLVGQYEQSTIDEYLVLSNNNIKNYFIRVDAILRQMRTRINVNDYSDYIDSVLNEAEDLLSYVNPSNNPFRYRYLNGLVSRYTALEDVEISNNNSLAIDAIVSSNYRELTYFVFIFFMVYTAFLVDEKSDMLSVVSITKSGPRSLALNKLSALVIIVSSFIFINEFVLILYAFIKFGPVNPLVSIQSFTSLLTSPFRLNVFQLLTIVLVYKLVYGIFITMLSFFTTALFKNKSSAVFLITIVIGISAFLTFTIKDASALRNFKYLNLYSLSLIYAMLKQFIFLDLRLIHVSFLHLSMIMFVVLTILFTYLAYKTYSDTHLKQLSTKLNIKLKFKKIFESVNIFKHESIKTFMMEGNLIIIIVFISIMLGLGIRFSNVQQTPYNQNVNDFINEHGGKIDAKLLTFYEEKALIYKDITDNHEKMVKDFNNGLVSENDYQKHLSEYFEVYGDISIFNRAYKRLNESDKYLIDTSGYNILLSQYNYQNENLISAALSVLLILVFSNVYSIDKKRSEEELYKITKSSTKNTTKTKLVIGIVFTLIIVSVVYGSYYLLINKNYNLNFNHVAIKNVINLDINSYGFKAYPWLANLSITQFNLLVFVTRIIGFLFLMLTSLFVSKKVGNRTITILLLTFMFIIPAFLYLVGFELFSIVSVFDLIGGTIFYRRGIYMTKIFIVLVLDFILVVYLLVSGNRLI